MTIDPLGHRIDGWKFRRRKRKARDGLEIERWDNSLELRFPRGQTEAGSSNPTRRVEDSPPEERSVTTNLPPNLLEIASSANDEERVSAKKESSAKKTARPPPEEVAAPLFRSESTTEMEEERTTKMTDLGLPPCHRGGRRSMRKSPKPGWPSGCSPPGKEGTRETKRASGDAPPSCEPLPLFPFQELQPYNLHGPESIELGPISFGHGLAKKKEVVGSVETIGPHHKRKFMFVDGPSLKEIEPNDGYFIGLILQRSHLKKEEGLVDLKGGLLEETSPREVRSKERLDLGLGHNSFLQANVGRPKGVGKEGWVNLWVVFTTKSMEDFMEHFFEDLELEHKEELFSDSYFVDFEMEKANHSAMKNVCATWREKSRGKWKLLEKDELVELSVIGSEESGRSRRRKLTATLRTRSLSRRVEC
ncbi:unnamed protein product [Linum trigynum]|uniref:Uncharacterized protein n=1 Tax=Linum trigynum TaxID=586398 RepID=A0AAV2FC13_9ROSI